VENISRIRQRPSVTGQLFLLAAALTSGSAGDIRDYRLDLKGPARLIDSVPANPVPTRVEIFLTGPGIYIDKSETTDRLSRRIPDLVITNSANLFGLVQALCDDETKERLPNVMKRYGLTYHFLLVYEENKSLIHFRVFETTDQSRVWWHV
jgi:hypothetical protein